MLFFILYLVYFLIFDPEAVTKRSKRKSDDPTIMIMKDKIFSALMIPLFCIIFIFPGFDYSMKISPLSIPVEIKVLGFLGCIISLFSILYVNAVNRYASKGLVIHKDHELITSGPYRYIRHPMYLCFMLLFISIPLSLGSFIALLFSLLLPILILYRIGIEEEMLIKYLEGYKEYSKKVKFRLFPKIY